MLQISFAGAVGQKLKVVRLLFTAYIPVAIGGATGKEEKKITTGTYTILTTMTGLGNGWSGHSSGKWLLAQRHLLPFNASERGQPRVKKPSSGREGGHAGVTARGKTKTAIVWLHIPVKSGAVRGAAVVSCII